MKAQVKTLALVKRLICMPDYTTEVGDGIELGFHIGRSRRRFLRGL